MKPDIDYVVCPICGHEGKRIYKHIKKAHDLTLEEFREKYPVSETTCSSLRKQIQRNTKKSLNEEEVVRKRKLFRESEEGRDMASRNGRSVWNKPGFKEKLSEINRKNMIGLWEDPEFRETTSEKIRDSLDCDRVRELHNKRLKKLWRNDEYRRKMSKKAVDQISSHSFGVVKEFTKKDGTLVKYRSSWEFRVSEMLDDLGIEYQYESGRFEYLLDGDLRVYVPDFYIDSKKLYLEVKPEYYTNHPINVEKFKSVRNSGYKFLVVTEKHVFNRQRFLELVNSVSSTTIP